jgi:hypothetical protein
MPVKVRHSGVWKDGIPYIKSGGVWVQAPMYVNHAGVWYIVTETFDDPGSITYTVAGISSFIVPNYENFLTVKGWGGGGSGAYNNLSIAFNGTAGQPTKFGTLIANGGARGEQGGGTAAGGTASGGSTNITGGSGSVTAGGDGAGGGGAGGSNSNGNKDGTAPGGGGRGFSYASGGGGGGYFERTYNHGDLVPGSSITIEVAGTIAAVTANSGAGARGELIVSWG